ncbi:LysM peptidoglycan-binding domain-containing protein [Desulfitobacterium metallireducens]|uniref:Peptidoglycan-binding protein n=1 Tax=Desulfitobacterium metallireducens DSM 15288 TaxID=871968 RepID=W0EEB5_9FIRM|nr:peptidoglycan-binding protein [Desulfitobacterium metallireducens DSM 15288]
MPDYVIQRGDDYFRLAQRLGGTCEEWMLANPGINPLTLQIGQKIVLPELKSSNAHEQYAEISVDKGNQYAGDKMDDVEMEIEGVRFRIKRIGESRVPHEIHLIVPRTEIRKIQPQGEHGPCEVQIMLSNVDIVHSPRLMSEGGGTTVSATAPSAKPSSGTANLSFGQSPGISGTTTQQSQSNESVPSSQFGPNTSFAPTGQMGLYGEQSQPMQNPLTRTQELGFDIRQMRPQIFRK